MQELKLENQMRLPTKIKICLIGDAGSGKTSLIINWMYGTFDSHYKSTIGVGFLSRTISQANGSLRLQIWDTAGQSRFSSLLPSYVRDSRIVVLVFSVTDRASFTNLQKHLDMVKNERPEATYLLLGNKIDCCDRRIVTQQEAEDYASQEGLVYLETSAKTPGISFQALEREIFKAVPNDDLSDMAIQAPPVLRHIPENGDRASLLASVATFAQARPHNRDIQDIGKILNMGLSIENTSDAQAYFNQKFETLKGHLNTLQMTSRSLLNSALNIVITVLLAVSVIGLPLAYCSKLLAANERASGHKFMFISSIGAKQAAQIACHEAFKETGNESLKFSRSY